MTMTINEINQKSGYGLFRIMRDLQAEGVIQITPITGNKYKITGIGENGAGKVSAEEKIGKNNKPYTSYQFNETYATELITKYGTSKNYER